ncbi:MAG: DNRLRE domain-containing protein, partial [Pseudomonadota bacterium]
MPGKQNREQLWPTSFLSLLFGTALVTAGGVSCGELEEAADTPEEQEQEEGRDQNQGVDTVDYQLASVSFPSIADSQVDSANPGTSYGSGVYLGCSLSPDKRSYLKFSVTSLPGSAYVAKLRLYVSNSTVDGPAVYVAASNTWDEATITWNNQPGFIGDGSGDRKFVPRAGYTDWDVTSLITAAGTYSFVLVGQSADNMNVRSKEDVPEQRPSLVVEALEEDESVQSFPATADAAVWSAYPTKNYGSSIFLSSRVLPDKRSYLKFPVAGVSGSVSAAKLRLFVSDATNDAPALHASAATWQEGTITWENQPGPGEMVADLGTAASGGYVEYDVSSLVTGDGLYGFVLMPQSTNVMTVRSREDDEARRPQLRVFVRSEDTGDSEEGTDGFQDGVAPTTSYAGTTDTTLSQTSPTSNYGTAKELIVDGDNPTGSTPGSMALVRWDVSAIPRGALASAASMVINVTRAANETYYIYDMSRPWKETEATWEVGATGQPW